MSIKKDQVVRFHYHLKDAQGEAIETTEGGQPMAYLHGHDNLLPAMEEAMEGRNAGETFSITLSPEDAYGQRVEGSIQRIPIKHLRGAKKWRPGMIAWIETDEGQRQVKIVKVGKFSADVDTNHPLAGMTLTFDISILDMRDATADEIQHGHAHGDGGHHH